MRVCTIAVTTVVRTRARPASLTRFPHLARWRNGIESDPAPPGGRAIISDGPLATLKAAGTGAILCGPSIRARRDETLSDPGVIRLHCLAGRGGSLLGPVAGHAGL